MRTTDRSSKNGDLAAKTVPKLQSAAVASTPRQSINKPKRQARRAKPCQTLYDTCPLEQKVIAPSAIVIETSLVNAYEKSRRNVRMCAPQCGSQGTTGSSAPRLLPQLVADR
jgi:hypothetical protein